MSTPLVRTLLAGALAAVVLAVTATSATANPPAGRWTLVHRDGYLHYACKTLTQDGDRWRLRTATWFNNRQDTVDLGIGVYAAVARGGNRRLVSERSRDAGNFTGGYLFMELRGSRTEQERLWVQAAAYGPPAPWRDGFDTERIRRCDPR